MRATEKMATNQLILIYYMLCTSAKSFHPKKTQFSIYSYNHKIDNSIVIINCSSRLLDGKRGRKKIDSLIDSVEAEQNFCKLSSFRSLKCSRDGWST